ncbi:hypothetical protein NDU88_001025 [Pleurodeles waltl]|uniref:Uncharacterized protein n=1 Tax=Pleurodeles waltl TaxID=8319 RepID=A0AAV7NCA9_PLEWA|nr:hypothetical protein NDU88_001025 [Pleurodeles waltl]
MPGTNFPEFGVRDGVSSEERPRDDERRSQCPLGHCQAPTVVPHRRSPNQEVSASLPVKMTVMRIKAVTLDVNLLKTSSTDGHLILSSAGALASHCFVLHKGYCWRDLHCKLPEH